MATSWFSYVPYAVRAMQYRGEIEALVEEAIPVIRRALTMVPELQKLFDKAKALAVKIAPELFKSSSQQEQLPLGPAPRTVSPSTSSKYDVEWLQTTLNHKTPGMTPLAIDGIYGPGTKARVEAYQQAHGLNVDGWAGIETMTSLLS
jgi:peptidoglycan hydrolase-like protein with peptidoglycan-binding domain